MAYKNIPFSAHLNLIRQIFVYLILHLNVEINPSNLLNFKLYFENIQTNEKKSVLNFLWLALKRCSGRIGVPTYTYFIHRWNVTWRTPYQIHAYVPNS
jgi:hypothetical protein